MAREWRTYTDADREAARVALELNGNNLRDAARTTGIPVSTIKTWRDTPAPTALEQLPAAVLSHACEVLRTDKKGEVIEAAWNLAAAAFKRAEEALPDAGARDAAVVAGIAIDKAQLLNGDATQRVDLRAILATFPPDLGREVGRLLAGDLSG